ncbi:MAG TPA: Nramp family divalent metal transporter [Thermoleophilia bacterium]|nr:Nramp family divalent metal transporter [Thermoleophilia bacterium]
MRYLGPGFVVTIGFIDPGNWATNIAGGSQFGYSLLWVITLSTLMLIFLQHVSARLGIVTGHSLAVNVRRHFSRPLVWLFGASIVPALVATSLAEILGGALGFQILFHIPLGIGAVITLAFVVIVVLGQRYDRLERLIIVFLAFIAGAYIVELFIVKPDWAAAAPDWFIPHVTPGAIVVAMGMLGAIVMPHNIYLHSNTIQSREWDFGGDDQSRLMRFELIDTSLSMGMGWLVNSSMILVAAAVFYAHGIEVTSIAQASATLQPLVGSLSRLLFGLALLVAGLSSSITSSLATANVVSGYLGRPEDPHSRTYRYGLVLMALPAVVLITIGLNAYHALIISQVVLSVQLPFTIVPLLMLTQRRSVMGEMRAGGKTKVVGWTIAAIIVALNVYLLYQTFKGG